jgi:hypothetical protein
MMRTRNWHVSHAWLVAGVGSCAPLMPRVMRQVRSYATDKIGLWLLVAAVEFLPY